MASEGDWGDWLVGLLVFSFKVAREVGFRQGMAVLCAAGHCAFRATDERGIGLVQPERACWLGL